MSLPIEPESGLFADDAEPAFVRSEEVESLAIEVMGRWPEFELIRTAVDDGLSIAYVIETKPFDPLKDEYKRHVVAKVTKASPLWECLADVRLAIQFREWFWNQYTRDQRAAVIYHELRHIEVEEPDNPGQRLKIRLKPHDLEEFYGVARRYGTVLPDIEKLIKVHSWWLQEQPGAALEPGSVVDTETGEITEGTVEALDPGIERAARKFGNAMRALDVESVSISTTIDGVRSEPVTLPGRRSRRP